MKIESDNEGLGGARNIPCVYMFSCCLVSMSSSYGQLEIGKQFGLRGMTRNKKDCQGSTRINKIAKRYLKIRYLKIKAAEMRVTSDILQCPTVTLSAHVPWAALEMLSLISCFAPAFLVYRYAF